MAYIKEALTFLWLLAALTTARADGYKPGLEDRVDMLSAEVRQLARQISELAKQNSEIVKENSELAEQNSEIVNQNFQLERKITNIQTKTQRDVDTPSLMFDCYLHQSWSAVDEPITFTGCEGKIITP